MHLSCGLVHAIENQIVKADDMDAEAPLHNDVYDALGISGQDRGGDLDWDAQAVKRQVSPLDGRSSRAAATKAAARTN